MRGITLALIGVALAAVAVSFFSSAKERLAKGKLKALEKEVLEVKQVREVLQKDLEDVRAKLRQEAEFSKELQEALSLEQRRSTELAEKLAQQTEAEGNEPKAKAGKTTTTNVVLRESP